MGFVDFTKLSFALSSLAQPFDQMESIPEYVFVILSQRKAYKGHLGTASWFVFKTLMHSCNFCMMHPGVILGLRGSILNGMTNVDTITSK